MKELNGKEGLVQQIVQSIKMHVKNRNPMFVCLVEPGTKLRDLGYLNRCNIEELLIFIKTFNQKLVINFDVELKDPRNIDRLVINDIIKKAQGCICAK